MEAMVKIGPGRVTLVKWNDFYEAMLQEERTGSTWTTLLQSDFIFGGFSFHGDFWYVRFCGYGMSFLI